MSGIYISNLKMPDNAEGCEVIIRIQPNGEVLDAQRFHLGMRAVPVPDHGRLIDADAAARHGWKIHRTYQSSPTEMTYEDKLIDSEVLPTIIPASGGNENE